MSETKKYELTSETFVLSGHTLHRIRALKDFGSINAGELGGWVEKEENLSQYGNAWVYGSTDYIVFKNFWSSGRYFTWTRSNNMWKVGCFYGTGKELIIKAYADSEISGREYERVVRYVEGILADEKKTSN